MKIFNLIFILSFSLVAFGQSDLFQSQIATSLNTITLYPDSTFIRHSNISYPAGELFKVLNTSKLEHEDDAQNQKFRWYEVRTPDGNKGWIFGDGIAILMADKTVPTTLQPFHKKQQSFNYGFENSTMWIAAVEGRDNFHEQDYLNPIYNELYLIITNQNKKSVHIGVAGVSARGEYQLDQLVFRDATGDGVADIIVEKNHTTERADEVIKSLEIYTFRAGNIGKALDESLNVKMPDGLRVPPLFKFVEVDDQTVRLEYLQFNKVENKLPNVEQAANLYYKILTYNWNERQKKYESLYGETSIMPRGQVKVGNSFLLSSPQPNAVAGKYVPAKTDFRVLQQIDNQNDESYYLIQLADGKKGYLPAEEVVIQDAWSGDKLQAFQKKKPLPVVANQVKILLKVDKL
ncbi:MAG: hypothetical protein AB8G22_24985 [Saprospiraceae bacterium]